MIEKKTRVVGITGGIGAGKTLVTKLFALLGVPVYLADDRAKWLMTNHPPLKQRILAAFGAESYLSDGSLNRPFLASRVFSDSSNTEVINKLVHPCVAEDFKKWTECQPYPYVLKEAALLFESGSYRNLDKIITVTAPESLRVFRVLLRDPHRSRADIERIMERQWPEQQKRENADFVIENDERKMVIPQVLKIHQRLMQP
jgi:dephospho-CoA kinase